MNDMVKSDQQYISLKEMRKNPEDLKAFISLFYNVGLEELNRALKSIYGLAHSKTAQTDEEVGIFQDNFEGAAFDPDSNLGRAVSNYLGVLEAEDEIMEINKYLNTFCFGINPLPFIDGLRYRYGKIMGIELSQD